MKRKLAITGAAALAFAGGTAHAQSAGDFYVSTGWLHLSPQDSSDPLFVYRVGGTPINQSIPNTGAGINDADTLGRGGLLRHRPYLHRNRDGDTAEVRHYRQGSVR